MTIEVWSRFPHASNILLQYYDFPWIFCVFRKFSIVPATQNKCERLFSLVGRITGPLSRNIKVETIERKVVVGSAVQKHGFIFNFEKGNDSSSSEEADSF